MRVAGKAGHNPRNRRMLHPEIVRCSWGARPRKNYESHIDASLSRQPLVKGERLVRYEVNAVMAVQRLSSLRVGRMCNNCHVSLAGLTWTYSPLLAAGMATHFGAAQATEAERGALPCPWVQSCYPEGCAATSQVQCQCDARGSLSKLAGLPPRRKINVTSKSPVGDISVVTLIRTDTTLDHSQKAEKV